jgi:hypothetical protein
LSMEQVNELKKELLCWFLLVLVVTFSEQAVEEQV